MDLSQIKTELGNYFRVNNKEVRAMVYQKPELVNYTRPVTKVKGKFPALHSVTGNVVQGFSTVWNAMGVTKMKVNELVNYHQKVNFSIVPDDVENSWLAELDQLNLKPADRPISKYIVENELSPRVVADVEDLSINGVYDADNLGTYGKSMNGLLVLFNNGINSNDNPMYRINVPAPTPETICDVVDAYELQIPSTVSSSITKIFMSKKWAELYRINFRSKYGTTMDYSKSGGMQTFVGSREIVILNKLNGSNIIFATPDSNFLRLIDIVTPPTVSDIQVLDYEVKIFMDWWLGFGFWFNQMVMVSYYAGGTASGLKNDQSLYY